MTRLPLSLVLAAVAAAVAPAAESRRSNVLVILADDMGYGDLGVHGCKDVPTPHAGRASCRPARCTTIR
jgi:hypothetical protein